MKVKNLKLLRSIFPHMRDIDVEQLYYRLFSPYGESCHLYRYHRTVKVGGGGGLYQTNENGTDISIKVDVVEGIRQEGEHHIWISDRYYFFRPETGNRDKSCAVVTVQKDYGYGILGDVNTYRECFRVTGMLDGIDRKKRGEILINLVISYCRHHYREMGIIGLELSDNSYYQCSKSGKRADLFITRQLLGVNPYYMKFGFRPVNVANYTVYDRNIKLVEKLRLSDRAFYGQSFIEWLEDILRRRGSSLDVLQLIKDYSGDTRLTEIFSAIIRGYCVIWCSIHKNLFAVLRLEDATDDMFRLRFRERSYSI
jgi:hypothetical protein